MFVINVSGKKKQPYMLMLNILTFLEEQVRDTEEITVCVRTTACCSTLDQMLARRIRAKS